MPIPTYFSHSYRLQDQELNKTFWGLFSDRFSFFVDPPSDVTIHTHLERMMGRCSAFVAIVNERPDAPPFLCSPFVLYEYGLSIQARRPKLLLIDDQVQVDPFKDLKEHEKHIFLADDPLDGLDELVDKIDKLHQVAQHFPNRQRRGREPIAVLVPRDRSRCAYADPQILARIEYAAGLGGFTTKVVEIPADHNALFALSLDKYPAVVLDVRGKDLPKWVFAYVYGRLIPTIKLARVLPKEIPCSLPLPPLVMGLRMDAREPGVESVTYWRDPDDLVSQLTAAFRKLNERQAPFKDGRHGELYFDSIRRRPARVFISNANPANGLARELGTELRLRNIEFFQYKEPDHIETGSPWQEKILDEVRTCQVFIALVGPGYGASEWCRREMEEAGKRRQDIELMLYEVEKTDLQFMGTMGLDGLQVAPLPANRGEAVNRVIDNLQDRLTRDERGRNRPFSRTTMLGASRESIIDAIRHVPRAGWPNLLARLGDAGIQVDGPDQDAAPVRRRDTAERLFTGAQRAADDAGGDQDPMGVLVAALAEFAPPRHRAAIADIAERIGQRPSDV